MVHRGNLSGQQGRARPPIREGTLEGTMANQSSEVVARGCPAPMGENHPAAPLLEEGIPQVLLAADQLIQHIPLSVREKIYADLVASKTKHKTTLQWLVTHRAIRGWGAIHWELGKEMAHFVQELRCYWCGWDECQYFFPEGWDLVEEEDPNLLPCEEPDESWEDVYATHDRGYLAATVAGRCAGCYLQAECVCPP